jgi:hypothetical protein
LVQIKPGPGVGVYRGTRAKTFVASKTSKVRARLSALEILAIRSFRLFWIATSVGAFLKGCKQMVKHIASQADQVFRRDFEACLIPPTEFNHRAHVRLAYVYLSENDIDTAHQCMRTALFSFIKHNGIDVAKYHETITRAWIMAVRHFMENTPSCESYEAFIEGNPRMLDSKIMMTHYSSSVLFTDEARSTFVEPDLQPIPRYES